MNDKEKTLICELFEKQIDDSLTPEEALILEELVLKDQEAQDFYFDLTIQNSGLEDQKLSLAGEALSSMQMKPKTKKALPFIYKLSLIPQSLYLKKNCFKFQFLVGI